MVILFLWAIIIFLSLQQLQEKYDALAEQNRKLKAQIKTLNAKLKSLTGNMFVIMN